MLALYLALIDDEREQELFIELYNEYEKPMLHIAKIILKEKCLAEDAVQNAFLGIAKNMNKVSVVSKEKISGYLLICARNAALDIRRKEKKFIHADIDLLYNLSDEKASGDIRTLEERTYMVCIFEKISPTYRDVMYMNLILGMSAIEIGKVLGIRANNVRQRLLRGRQQFMQYYSSEMNSDGNE